MCKQIIRGKAEIQRLAITYKCVTYLYVMGTITTNGYCPKRYLQLQRSRVAQIVSAEPSQLVLLV